MILPIFTYNNFTYEWHVICKFKLLFGPCPEKSGRQLEYLPLIRKDRALKYPANVILPL